MQQPQLNGIKACVFDAYGTLFDVHSAVGTYRQQVGKNADAELESLVGLPALVSG